MLLSIDKNVIIQREKWILIKHKKTHYWKDTEKKDNIVKTLQLSF